MGKQIKIIFCVMALFLVTACSSSTNSGSGTTSAAASTAGIAISPSSVTLAEGGVYTFVGSGGTGTYTYMLLSGVGTIDFYSGNYTAPETTGSAVVEVIDSGGNTASATITVSSSSSSTGTVTGTSSVTGNLTNCVGLIGGSADVNNWQVNGTELRTVNDADYFIESPINCTGLSIAGTIPSDATILGVTVNLFLINQSTSYDGSVLQGVTLINSNSFIGNTTVVGSEIPGKNSSYPTFSEGANGNTWGATLTPAIVNSTSFGVNIETYRGMDRLFLGTSGTVFPQVTIYYSE